MASRDTPRSWRDPLVATAIRAAIPLFIPAIPFALVLGVAITESAMPTGVAWSTGLLIFAGSAQLATVSLAATATWVTLVATAAVINLRHVMYSAALSHRFADQPKWFRWVGPFFLIDQLFVLAAPRTRLSSRDWRVFYLSAGIFNFVVWNLTVTVGMIVGSAIPTEWRLDLAPAIMFAGLVAIGLTEPTRHHRRGDRRRRLPRRARGPQQRRDPHRCRQRCHRRIRRRRRPVPPAAARRGARSMSMLAAVSAVLSVALITYASRAGLIVFLADRPLPPHFTRALRYVGPAVLSALTVNLIAGGQGIDGIETEELVAVGVGVVVAAVARNLIVSLAAGMVSLWVLLWLM